MPDTAAAPVLSLEVERCAGGNAVLVHCHGRLVVGTTDILRSAIVPLIPTCKRIILELSDLSHTDSMGLGTLVRLYLSTKSDGCSLELMHLSRQIRNLLGLTNLFGVFTVIGESGAKFM
jgi:anti-anti-sigma factor